MKRKIQLLVLILTAATTAYSQTYPSLKFRKPTTSGASGWRFKSVTTNIDAIITVVSTKNASLGEIDDSTKYANAWNPFINISSTPTRSTDSSYVEFNIAFVKAGTNTPQTMTTLAMGIVDLDGGLNGINIFHEMVKVSQPATSKGMIGTLINSIFDQNWITNVSGAINYSNMDTSNWLAMSQINYSNINNFTMKVGTIGKVTGGSTREFSFYPKNFAPLTLALPVELVNLNAVNSNNSNIVTWATTMENNANRFEIYRSVDGQNFQIAGQTAAMGNSNTLNNYSFTDASATGNTYYKIRVVDNNGESIWSSAVFVKGSAAVVSDLYPNPTSGTLNLNLANESGSDFSLEVVDMFGKVMQSYTGSDLSNSFSMDVTGLNKGVYFVKVTDADGNATSTRFIKN